MSSHDNVKIRAFRAAGAMKPAECGAVRQWVDRLEMIEALTAGIQSEEKRKSHIRWLYPGDLPWVFKRVTDCIQFANLQVFKAPLSGVEAIQVTRYQPGEHYNWHSDSGADNRERSLSCVIQLSPHGAYSGGELLIGDDFVAPKDEGSIVVFPSWLMHKANEVRLGVRHSLVCWAHK